MNPWFTTDTGRTVPVITAAQMREVDRIAMGETGPNHVPMMENAGTSLAPAAIDMIGSGWRGAPVLSLDIRLVEKHAGPSRAPRA